MDKLHYKPYPGTPFSIEISTVENRPGTWNSNKVSIYRDELLIGEEQMKKVTTLRHMLSMLGDEERTMMLIEKLGKTKDNAEFLDTLAQG